MRAVNRSPMFNKKSINNSVPLPNGYPAFSPYLVNMLLEIKNTLINANLYLDLLTCDNGLFKYEKKLPQFNIRYADNPLGTPNDWILDQPNNNKVSIKDLYFTSCIDEWNYTLNAGTNLRKDLINGTEPNLSNYITAIVNPSYPLAYTFTLNSDIIWPYDPVNGSDNYIQLLNGDVFDGKGHTIKYVDGNGSTYGLFSTNTYNVFDLPEIKDLHIHAQVISPSNSGGGGFIRNGYCNFNLKDCHFKGSLYGDYCGGLCSQPFLNIILLVNLI